MRKAGSRTRVNVRASQTTTTPHVTVCIEEAMKNTGLENDRPNRTGLKNDRIGQGEKASRYDGFSPGPVVFPAAVFHISLLLPLAVSKYYHFF